MITTALVKRVHDEDHYDGHDDLKASRADAVALDKV